MYQQSTSVPRANAISSIDFAIQSVQEVITTSIVGNMGAPLRTGEFAEPGECALEKLRFSKDPFSVDLGPQADSEEWSDEAFRDAQGGVAGPSRMRISTRAQEV